VVHEPASLGPACCAVIGGKQVETLASLNEQALSGHSDRPLFLFSAAAGAGAGPPAMIP
jgi:hypothetical protein